MKWIGVPDNATVFVTTPKPLYPAVGGPDDLTEVLDSWETTHTDSCTVINLLDNNQA